MPAVHHAHSADEVHKPVCPKCRTRCPACPKVVYTDDRYLPRTPVLRRLQVEDW